MERYRVDPEDEVSEDELASFELPRRLRLRPRPSALSGSADEDDALHHSIVCRTIITAARGACLRRLELLECSVHAPFAIRALVPRWLRFQVATRPHYRGHYGPFPLDWQGGSGNLRSALAHASLWLPGPGGNRITRFLTHTDVQALFAFYSSTQQDFIELEGSKHYAPLAHYLRWLQEDDHLAQQVADIWNAWGAHGEERLPSCYCQKCKDHFASG